LHMRSYYTQATQKMKPSPVILYITLVQLLYINYKRFFEYTIEIEIVILLNLI
jgi:hypothetical protein